ncbi:MAG: amino acid permease, partial [Bacteroidota bacterium]
AIGAYVSQIFPDVHALPIAIGAYLLFTGLNMWGVEAAASFELFITVIAVGGLLLFAGTTLPAFEWVNLEKNALPNGWGGAFAALPFAIWFYLAIEGVANVAEETVNPQRNVLIGFGSAILTLVILCILTFLSSVGVEGWESLVYDASGEKSDAPLPLAMAAALGEGHWLIQLLAFIGLFGLVASFHGIILAAGRATYEFGKVGFAPAPLGKIHPTRKTPANALIVNMGIGILALLTEETGAIITIACFGALSMYIIAMVSFFRLRQQEPEMERPFRVPLYPLLPLLAIGIATIALLAIFYYNLLLGAIFGGIMLGSWALYRLFLAKAS